MEETKWRHRSLHLSSYPGSTSEEIKKQNGNGFSGLAKGLFIGSLLGAAVALLFLPRSRTALRSDIPKEGVRYPRRYRPLSMTRVEKVGESGKPVKSSIGWRVIFYVASAVAMFADLRIKKT